jgi:hypothetical protein
MSSTMPGIGSIVIYYYNDNVVTVPVPAVVVCTHDSWVPDFPYVSGQPSANQVAVYTLMGNQFVAMATEGTGEGQFSRLSLSLGLSAQIATGVVVPDV